jgi:2'-5' RNA ligase
MDNNLIRSFIAIELPAEVSATLEEIQKALKSPQHNFVKWVPPMNIHITLKFLGNVSSEKIASITSAMEQTSQAISPFQLKLGEIGAFPNLKQPRILWIGVKGETDKLKTMQANLEEHLARLGFTRESRGFTPHLTLARLREGISSVERHSFGDLIAEKSIKVDCQFAATKISLMKSQLLPSGAVYTRLTEVKLKD